MTGQTKRYSRKATTTTVSIFYEHYEMKKYNFDPPYQRDYNVWNDEQKQFLIDTIMKNFPIPPIFLEQKIDSITGKTTFDVIDGKQRLQAIIAFVNNQIPLPLKFGNDTYGLEIMNGKIFSELQELAQDNKEVENFMASFWSYIISIEYIENPDVKVVDNIFDRLNRGGERLNNQELRKANYYDSCPYCDIECLRKNTFIESTLNTLNKSRLEDISFITELYLLVWKDKIVDGVESEIDKYFKEAVETIDNDESKRITTELIAITNIVNSFNLDLDKYRIRGVSHLYAIWYLAYFIYKHQAVVQEIEVEKRLNAFYEDLRGEKTNSKVNEYHASMQSASKYKTSRKKRIIALLDYFELTYDPKKL